MKRISFTSDYMEGAHPLIMQRLMETNLEKTPGYGTDAYCEAAKAKIRSACHAPEAEIFFLVGGTQTNATVIDGLLQSYQGVIAAETGHIGVHEAGAIEFGGHKVLTLPHKNGKITAQQIEKLLCDYANDANRDHMVMPGMAYLSQPTEYGTLYSRAELTQISSVCRAHRMPLYVDGARLAYALACPENDVSLADLAALCDAFYIGGTKCGALFGEAVIINNPDLDQDFRYAIKQHGAMLAKGRLLGLQFLALLNGEDGTGSSPYYTMAAKADRQAMRIRAAFEAKGCAMLFDSPTNQQFPILPNSWYNALSEKYAMTLTAKPDAEHTAVRFCTSWATRDEDVDALLSDIASL